MSLIIPEYRVGDIQKIVNCLIGDIKINLPFWVSYAEHFFWNHASHFRTRYVDTIHSPVQLLNIEKLDRFLHCDRTSYYRIEVGVNPNYGHPFSISSRLGGMFFRTGFLKTVGSYTFQGQFESASEEERVYLEQNFGETLSYEGWAGKRLSITREEVRQVLRQCLVHLPKEFIDQKIDASPSGHAGTASVEMYGASDRCCWGGYPNYIQPFHHFVTQITEVTKANYCLLENFIQAIQQLIGHDIVLLPRVDKLPQHRDEASVFYATVCKDYNGKKEYRHFITYSTLNHCPYSAGMKVFKRGVWVAHEAGHIRLNHLNADATGSLNSSQERSMVEEQEADVFAWTVARDYLLKNFFVIVD